MFISLMIIVTVSDLYYNIVPDVILLLFLPIILGLRMFSPVMIWYEGLIGAVIGFSFMLLMSVYGKKRFFCISMLQLAENCPQCSFHLK